MARSTAHSSAADRKQRSWTGGTPLTSADRNSVRQPRGAGSPRRLSAASTSRAILATDNERLLKCGENLPRLTRPRRTARQGRGSPRNGIFLLSRDYTTSWQRPLRRGRPRRHPRPRARATGTRRPSAPRRPRCASASPWPRPAPGAPPPCRRAPAPARGACPVLDKTSSRPAPTAPRAQRPSPRRRRRRRGPVRRGASARRRIRPGCAPLPHCRWRAGVAVGLLPINSHRLIARLLLAAGARGRGRRRGALAGARSLPSSRRCPAALLETVQCCCTEPCNRPYACALLASF